MEAQLAKREAELARDQYDLFNRAYDRNPGGDLLNKGTYVGHVKVIEGYRVGLIKAIAEAKKMGVSLMNVINSTVLDKLLQLFGAEKLPVDSTCFEIQEDGQFLLISIPIEASTTYSGERIASLVEEIVPRRPDDDSWMVVFTRGDAVVDSYSGGNLASTASG